MENNVWVSLIVMFLTIYSVRALPLTLLRKEIKSPWLRSFLYYIPYVSLSVMTFPAILSSTGTLVSGIVGFAAALILAWMDGNLFRVSLGACLAVYLTELFFV